MKVRKQHSEANIKQQTDLILGKECLKAVYCHPAYLTCMLSTSCKMTGWMKHKLESRLQGEIPININNLRYAESKEELKSLLMKVKEESEKDG